MTTNNRWLLPDGVEEILPQKAWQIEQFRRKTLALYQSWGYQLVIPPLIEYSESLLIGLGSDMDLQTFKLVDQLSGRSLAIRADMTPQTARIDAHSWKAEGINRFCYVGTVVRTKPKNQLSSRLSIEIGAELYGCQSLAGDKEIISLMIESLKQTQVKQVHLDLGHIGIYRGLIEAANLPCDVTAKLSSALERKASAEVAQWVAEYVKDSALAEMFNCLTELNGDVSVLEKAQKLLAKAPEKVQNALSDLRHLADWFSEYYKEVPLVLDLAELRGYQYHTGLVFAAYIDGLGHSVANGGRFDNIGEAYGKARPATGFSLNINALRNHLCVEQENEAILAPAVEDKSLHETVKQLRSKGQQVVYQLENENQKSYQYHLVKQQDGWKVEKIN